jgi:hypothetical protein
MSDLEKIEKQIEELKKKKKAALQKERREREKRMGEMCRKAGLTEAELARMLEFRKLIGEGRWKWEEWIAFAEHENKKAKEQGLNNTPHVSLSQQFG